MTNFEKLLALVTAEYQRLETAWTELANLSDAYLQAGINLDRLGARVGVLRGGRSDSTYRTAILAAFQAQLSGTTEQIIAYLKDVFGYVDVTLTQEENGTLFVETSGDHASIEQLQAVAPAGVALLPATYAVTEAGDGIVTADGHKIMVVEGAVEVMDVEDALDAADTAEDTLGADVVWLDTVN